MRDIVWNVSEPHAPFRGSATRLIDREGECRLLDQLLAAVRDGESRALILHGEAGVGKTALLAYLSERASDAGCQVVGAAGVQSEMELAFASLHQLCTPFLGRLNAIKGVHILVEAIRSSPRLAVELDIFGIVQDDLDYVDSLRSGKEPSTMLHYYLKSKGDNDQSRAAARGMIGIKQIPQKNMFGSKSVSLHHGYY